MHWQRLQEITGEIKKTFRLLDTFNVSKEESLITDECFNESTSVSSEMLSLNHPSIKRQGLDQDNMANYRLVSNMTS